MRVPDNYNRLLIVAAAALGTFLLQFAFRGADDNSLASWRLMLTPDNVPRLFLLLAAGVVVAFRVSRIEATERAAVIMLCIFSFAGAALYWDTPNFILDSTRYFTQAKHLELYGTGWFLREWGGEIAAWTDLPAGPLLYGVIFKTLGESRLAIQILTTALLSLTLFMTARLGKTLWDEDTGLHAAALLLAVSYLYALVPVILVDIPQMFLLTLAVYAVIETLKRGGTWRVVFTSGVIFLLFFTKYSSWPMLSVLLFTIPACLSPGDGSRRRSIVSRAGSIIALSGALIGAVLFLKFDVFAEQVRFLRSFQGPGLRRWGESFLSTFFFQMHPFITLAALYSIYAAAKKRDVKYLVIAWLPVLAVAFQIKRIRYLVPVFPMLALMASYGLQQIKDRDIRKFVISCAVVSSFVIGTAAYLPFIRTFATVNIKEAGAFLNTLEVKAAQVHTIVQKGEVANPAVLVPLLDLHTQKKLLYRYQPENFPPAAEIAMSKTRFTWEYKNPRYYDYDDKMLDAGTALVVISRNPDEALPPALELKARRYSRSRIFDTYDGVYYYRIAVRVYW